MTKTDSILLENIKKADESVLIEIYKNCREEFVLWLIKKYGCGLNEALEIYQHSILTLCENMQKDTMDLSTVNIKTYLFALGKHKYAEYKRYRKRYNKDEELPLVSILEMYEEFNNEEELLEYEKNLKKVRKCLKVLGEPCKSLLEMFYYKNKSYAKISKLLNYRNEDTVKNQKYKCMERLKKIMDPQSQTFTH